MAESDRIENPVLREYLYHFVPNIIEKNPLFVKIYGKGFARTKMRENVLTVYSNEPYGLNGRAAYHTGGDKSITFCCLQEEMSNILPPEKIANDKKMQEIATHESIHAILERSEQECKKYCISSGTGVLEKYFYPDGTYNEIGRGLNEGLTVWLCEKLGFEAIGYKELTNFVRLIEAAIGTEKTMSLGKGGIKTNFPIILNMPLDDVNSLLAMSDQVYVDNKMLQLAEYIIKVIRRHIDIKSYNNETQDEIQKEYTDAYTTIANYLKDPVFLIYAKNNNKEPTEEVLIQYLNDVHIKNLEANKQTSIINFESFVLDRFFISDLQEIFGSQEISDENFEKLYKLNSILNTNHNSVPDYIKNIKPPMSVIVFKEGYKKVLEKYVEQLALREAAKFNNGELELKQLIEKNIKLFDSSSSESEMFMKKFVKHITSKDQEEFQYYILGALKRAATQSDKYLQNLSTASIYKLKPEGNEQVEKGEGTFLVYDKENYLDRYYSPGTVLREKNGNYEFDFTTEIDNEYEIVMKQFVNLQEETFNRNPNAEIHITSRQVIVHDGDNIKFYQISKGQLIPMVVDKQFDFNFVYKENTQETAIVPIKIGIWSKFSNWFKREVNKFKNRKKDNIPNYTPEEEQEKGQIVFNTATTHSKKINPYRVNYSEHLETSISGKSEQNNELER